MRTTPILLLVIALLGPAPPAAAQETPAPPPPDVELIQQALGRIDSEGMVAAVELLESRRATAELSFEAESLLGTLMIEVGRGAEALEILEPLTEREEATAALFFHTWRAAQQAGLGAEKLGLLERSVEIDPISPAARALGLIRGQQGRLREAYLLLQPWVQAFPDDLQARMAAAVCAVELERIPEAEMLLAELPRDRPQVGILWGKVLMERGDPYGALATLKALPEDLPPTMDLDRRRTLATAHMSVGESDVAVSLLEGRVGTNPGLALLMAQAQSQSGDVEGALTTLTPFAEAIQADREALEARLGAGILVDYGKQLIATGRAEEAVEPLMLAAELDPDNKLAFQSLGQSLMAMGRREEAQVALERFNQLTSSEVPAVAKSSTTESDVDDPTGRELREALQLGARGRAAEALQIARAEAELAPRDPRPLLVEAQILHQLGRVDDAMSATDRAVELAPSHPDGHYQRAVLLMSLERLEEAETEYRAALEIAPEHVPSLNDLAVLLMTQERNDEARPLLEKALEINPDDGLAAQNLELLDGS